MKEINCTLCEYQSKSKQDMKIHLNTHMRKNNEGIEYPCDQCSYSASTPTNLRTHMKAQHEGVKYPCSICDYKAKYKCSLVSHIRAVHEGIKH